MREINIFLNRVKTIGLNAEGLKAYEDLTKEYERNKYIYESGHYDKNKFEKMKNEYDYAFKMFGGCEVIFNYDLNVNLVNLFFESKRVNQPDIPKGITKVDFNQEKDNLNQYFIQYLVNLKAERSFARDDDDKKAVKQIDDWFNDFERLLQLIFDSPELKIKFDRKNYNFDIVEPNKLPYSFNTLSDGYSAILSIISELILLMESKGIKKYDFEGIVLIDEIETHLHVDLQKKILPFLVQFFPRIQFIVSTHSPFVLSSISSSVIYDLEKNMIASDLSSYSYDALIESYFESDKYSSVVKDKIYRYEQLIQISKPSIEENVELKKLIKYFGSVPSHLSPELMAKLQEISLSQTGMKEGQ